MPNTAYAVSQSELGVADETTRGTPVAPAFWLPYMSPNYMPGLTMLEDKGLRGSAVDVYSLIPGLRHDELDWSGHPFLDSFPVLLRACLGSTDTTKVAPANTTLSSSAVAGATSVLTVATIAAGSWIAIGTGMSLETHVTTAVSGAGPFTVTLANPLANPQGASVAVTGLTGHKIGLLNNAGNGNQPPSLTLTDFDGEEWRQLAAAQLDSLDLKFTATGLLEYSTKFLSNPSTTPAPPTPSLSTVAPPPGWTLQVAIGGTFITYVLDGEVNLKRSTKPIDGSTGTQAPWALFAASLTTGGKITLIEQSGAPQLANYLNGSVESLDFTWFDLGGNALNIHSTSAKFKTGKITRGKEYVEAELEWTGQANATDAVAGGLAPIVTQTANGQTTAF